MPRFSSISDNACIRLLVLSNIILSLNTSFYTGVLSCVVMRYTPISAAADSTEASKTNDYAGVCQTPACIMFMAGTSALGIAASYVIIPIGSISGLRSSTEV